MSCFKKLCSTRKHGGQDGENRLSDYSLLLAASVNATAQEKPFYEGKTIRIVVGFTSGGFYDRWSRLLARYVPKYISGNPEMIVQNMPGAGALVAANPSTASRNPMA